MINPFLAATRGRLSPNGRSPFNMATSGLLQIEIIIHDNGNNNGGIGEYSWYKNEPNKKLPKDNYIKLTLTIKGQEIIKVKKVNKNFKHKITVKDIELITNQALGNTINVYLKK